MESCKSNTRFHSSLSEEMEKNTTTFLYEDYHLESSTRHQENQGIPDPPIHFSYYNKGFQAIMQRDSQQILYTMEKRIV